MAGLMGAAPPKINEQSDQEIRRAYYILIGDGGVQWLLADVYRRLEFDSVAAGGIFRLVPGAHGRQDLGYVDGLGGGGAVDLQQRVSVLETCLGSRTIGFHMQGLDAAAPIDPHRPVIGQAELLLLLEIKDGGSSRGNRQDGQDRG